MLALELNLWWGPRMIEAGGEAERLARFVNGLPAFDSAYDSWRGLPSWKKPILNVPTTVTEASLKLEEKFARRDSDGSPWDELGSSVAAVHVGAAPFNYANRTMAVTKCTIGSNDSFPGRQPNRIFMQLSKIRPSTGRPWRASELRPMMKFAREVWQPTDMLAMCTDFLLEMPKTPDPRWSAGMRSLNPWLGWITYLPPDLAARAKYPDFVEIETLEDGAALVTHCEEPFGKDDEAGVAKLTALQGALRPIQS